MVEPGPFASAGAAGAAFAVPLKAAAEPGLPMDIRLPRADPQDLARFCPLDRPSFVDDQYDGLPPIEYFYEGRRDLIDVKARRRPGQWLRANWPVVSLVAMLALYGKLIANQTSGQKTAWQQTPVCDPASAVVLKSCAPAAGQEARREPKPDSGPQPRQDLAALPAETPPASSPPAAAAFRPAAPLEPAGSPAEAASAKPGPAPLAASPVIAQTDIAQAAATPLRLAEVEPAAPVAVMAWRNPDQAAAVPRTAGPGYSPAALPPFEPLVQVSVAAAPVTVPSVEEARTAGTALPAAAGGGPAPSAAVPSAPAVAALAGRPASAAPASEPPAVAALGRGPRDAETVNAPAVVLAETRPEAPVARSVAEAAEATPVETAPVETAWVDPTPQGPVDEPGGEAKPVAVAAPPTRNPAPASSGAATTAAPREPARARTEQVAALPRPPAEPPEDAPEPARASAAGAAPLPPSRAAVALPDAARPRPVTVARTDARRAPAEETPEAAAAERPARTAPPRREVARPRPARVEEAEPRVRLTRSERPVMRRPARPVRPGADEAFASARPELPAALRPLRPAAFSPL